MSKISAAASKLAAVCLALLLLTISPGPASGQAEQYFTDLKASHTFGESISFSGTISPDIAVTSVELTFRPVSSGKSFLITADRQGDELSATYEIQPQDHIPPFGDIEFWFSAELEDGTQIQSEVETYVYTDTRFNWESITYENNYVVSWVGTEKEFGQDVLDAILKTNSEYSRYLDLPIPETLKVYVYPSSSALLSALEITNAPWVAGHADPANNTILVSIPQGFDQQLAIQRQIPHEVTHIRLYLYLQENYLNLPAWYSEGLASLSELYTLPEYWQVLQAAYKDDTLIPLETLCINFPSDTGQASLAYAEADSFTRFLFDRYGKFGLQSLLDAYFLGHSCENGISTAFNISLADLETEWKREAFNSAILPGSLSSGLAWVVLLGSITTIYVIVNSLPKRKR